MENSELLDLKMKSSEAYQRSMFMAPCDDGGSENFMSSLSSRPCARGKAPFTASQVQEFQRQSIICKYIMASMPVPPQLLLPLPTHPQSNNTPSGLDLKFSSGSDPEPWRCKRTDGKKWRCSRDVAPDQKYCERHAHKSKPRSRKPVEIHTTNNNRHPPPPKSNTNHHSLHFPTVQLSGDQTRCMEWLGRGDRSGTIPVQSSSGMDASFQLQDEYPMNFNQYMCGEAALGSQLKNRGTSRDVMDGGIANNGSFTSLTLSTSGWNHDDNQHTIGMLDSEVLRSQTQWLNPVSWMSSTAPGGPLGEALCLGNASTLPSPHGCSNSTGSCDNGLDE